MRGEQYLTRKEQFRSVYANGRSWANQEVVLRAIPNGLELSRYGFSVSRHLGKAVIRNKVKRRLREIVRKMPLKPGWDIVIIARAPAAGVKYADLGEFVKHLLYRAGLLIGEHESISPETH